MSLPKLDNWTTTSQGLHKGALLLGGLQRLTQPAQPAYLELGLQVIAQGLSGGRLPAGGRVVLDLAAVNLVYEAAGGMKNSIALDGKSQARVFAELFGTLIKTELAGILSMAKDEDLFDCVSRGIASKGGRYRPPKREILAGETTIQIDSRTAKAYLEVVQTVYTGIARFSAHHGGLRTPLVVWPEHFDLSTLMFEGNVIDESQPHLNFGFAPFSEGIERPYLYAYAYPYPEKYDPPALPEGADWHTQGWTGAVLPYDVIASQVDSQGYVEESCMSIYRGLHLLLGF